MNKKGKKEGCVRVERPYTTNEMGGQQARWKKQEVGRSERVCKRGKGVARVT